jgi:hypothetical protein
MRLRAASLTALLTALPPLVGLSPAGANPAAAPAAPALDLSLHSTPADALTAVLTRAERESGLRVVAFGEYHQTNATAKKGAPVSSLRRFSGELFGVLAPRASDIVLETWVTDGNCGSQETTAVAKVEKTTERPQNTENELVTLVKQAKSAGVQPHILRLSCDDYKSMLAADGQVDFEKLLGLLTTLLHKKITGIATARSAPAAKADGPANKGDAAKAPTAAPPAGPAPTPAPSQPSSAPTAATPPAAVPPVAAATPPPAPAANPAPTAAAAPAGNVAGDRLILVYGGGLHNDLLPRAELAAYTFGPKVRDEQSGRYLEVDLYVPEYIERDPGMTKEPWFQLYKKRVRPGQTVVIRRMQGSYIIVFPRRRG